MVISRSEVNYYKMVEYMYRDGNKGKRIQANGEREREIT
jgi:hypothetical protein